MRTLTTIGKNLKLLFRNKESAYTIVFGPILIILLVSFAFVGSSDARIELGVATEELTPLATNTIGRLQESYTVSVYPDAEGCISSVREGATHACIVFSPTEDGVTPVTFHLDYSRIDLVYQVIDELSDELGVQADEIRSQLASSALLRMQTAATLVEESITRAEGVQASLDATIESLGTASDGLSKIPNETLNITDIQPLSGYQLGLASNSRHIADEAFEAFDEARAIVSQLEDECDDCPEGVQEDIDEFHNRLDEAEDAILQITEDTQPQQLEEAQLIVRFAIDDLETIDDMIRNMSTAGVQVTSGVGEASADLDEAARELRRVSSRLEYTRDFLRGQETDVEALSAPVTIATENVAVSDEQLSFAYPYLLMLVVMFIGMLLSSMLIVTDKTSRAAFRNFTTPTSDLYHVVVSFLTAFCILILEIFAILLLSLPFVSAPLFSGSTLLLVFLATVMFTFLGMIIGYLSTTQEAAMIASISTASVLLFVSNLVLPVEGMARTVQVISTVNPYIVLSELLRRSMLYGVSAAQVGRELIVLCIFIFILIVFTVVVQRRIKKAYFRQEELLMPKRAGAPLHLGARLIHNEVDLMDALDRMTRDEFTRLVPQKENVVALWVEKERRNKLLARQLRTTSKERMILRLDKYLKRHGKRMKR